MEITLQRTFIFYIFIILVHAKINFAAETDSNSTSFKDVNALMLLKMGRQLDKPLLTLLGMAITNLHPCAQWTTWSQCTAVGHGYIGIRRRTRKCKGRDDIKESLKVKTETDFSICEGQCPDDYVVTSNGYCMKLYTTSKNQEEAEKQCTDDGGHLVNVNSDLKYSDFKIVRTRHSTYVHISGRRQNVNSPWIGSDSLPIEFIKWESGQPNNGEKELCLLINSDNLWHDALCTDNYGFICEIVN